MEHEPAIKWKKQEMLIKVGSRGICLRASKEGMENATTLTPRIAHVTQHQISRDMRARGTEALLFVIKECKTSVKAASNIDSLPADVRQLLSEFGDVLVHELPPGLLPSRSIDHHVELVAGNHKPPYRPVYKMSPLEMEEARRQIEELLAKGHTRPLKSPYGALILFARKKNGKLRMCIGYRALNDLTKKNRFPIPRIDEMLEKLRGSKYFSKLDLAFGCHQIRVAPANVEKTAFNMRHGHYEWLVMSFGMTNAPATFQTLMNEVFGDLLDRGVMVYLDDIQVHSSNRQQHLDMLRQVLLRLRKFKLYVQVAKCTFMQAMTEYLGHLITAEGIQMGPREGQGDSGVARTSRY